MILDHGAARIVVAGAVVAASLAFPSAPNTPEPPHRVVAAAPASSALREQELDTDVPIPPKAPPKPAPPRTNMPDWWVPTTGRLVQTPADEDLPDWVPIGGRLTVVESSDMAENLGLVPPGSTKASATKISVAAKLEEEAAERAAHPPAPGTPKVWTFIPDVPFVGAL